MSDKRDLLILGGGLVGMSLALAAARSGISSHVIDRADPADLLQDGFDGRASAISTASWNLFTNIGIADDLAPHGCPIDAIAVSDQLKPGEIRFRPQEGSGSLGLMFANRELRRAIFEAAQKEALIAWHAPRQVIARDRSDYGVCADLDDGTRLEAALMVAAEGRGSPTRDDAGIELAKWDYGHRAIIAGLTHELSHENVAWEIFYPAGPFALLPMRSDAEGQHKSALVWTISEKHASGALKLTDRAFIAEVEKRMGGIFGAVTGITARSSYPLSFQHTAKITDQRLVLVGDAAHGIHPIAGQGLNLGLRDVGALVEVLSDALRLGQDLGDHQALARYETWRSVDAFSVALATDGLTHLFGVKGRLASAVRRTGMAAVERSPWLKNWFMDEARGISGDMPEILQV